jgi:hypothetical protein
MDRVVFEKWGEIPYNSEIDQVYVERSGEHICMVLYSITPSEKEQMENGSISAYPCFVMLNREIWVYAPGADRLYGTIRTRSTIEIERPVPVGVDKPVTKSLAPEQGGCAITDVELLCAAIKELRHLMGFCYMSDSPTAGPIFFQIRLPNEKEKK